MGYDMSRDVGKRLEKYFPRTILDFLLEIGNKASEQEQNLYLVGGSVRDLLLKRANYDIDLVLEGDAIKFAEEVSRIAGSKLIVHRRFSTAKLHLCNFSLDIAMARHEKYNSPGALPEVQKGTIEDDLLRRDFSINAMAIALMPQRFGELIDLYGGMEDIEKRCLRILYSSSFIDDATRMFRIVRYEQRLGFEIDSHTGESLQRDIPMIQTISGDRLRNEVILMLKEEYPERAICRAGELGLLGELNSSLMVNDWLTKKFVLARSIFRRSISYPLYLCLLIWHLTEGESRKFVARLNFPAKLARIMLHTLHLKNKLCLLENDDIKSSDIYYLLREFELQAIQANLIATNSNIVRQRIKLYSKKLRAIQPFLNGQELIRMGVPDGIQIGEMLTILRRAKIDGEIVTYRDEQKLVYSKLKDL